MASLSVQIPFTLVILTTWTVLDLPSTAALLAFSSPLRRQFTCAQLCMKTRDKNADDTFAFTDKNTDDISLPPNPEIINRRNMVKTFFRATAASTVGLTSAYEYYSPDPANALAKISDPIPEDVATYDLTRDKLKDFRFAYGMDVGMGGYERDASSKKRELFQKLFSSLSGVPEPVIVEVGMGSFPNAKYYKGTKGLDIIGVDPNDSMSFFARDNAAKSGLFLNDSLRFVHGVGEALPLADNSCDAVVSTLTLCSVIDPVRCVAEIKRVLKPGGKFMFWEHVLSQTDPDLARKQIKRSPEQVRRADGCHLDRQTGEIIRNAGFKSLDIEYLEFKRYVFIGPTVCGIATT